MNRITKVVGSLAIYTLPQVDTGRLESGFIQIVLLQSKLKQQLIFKMEAQVKDKTEQPTHKIVDREGSKYTKDEQFFQQNKNHFDQSQNENQTAPQNKQGKRCPSTKINDLQKEVPVLPIKNQKNQKPEQRQKIVTDQIQFIRSSLKRVKNNKELESSCRKKKRITEQIIYRFNTPKKSRLLSPFSKGLTLSLQISAQESTIIGKQLINIEIPHALTTEKVQIQLKIKKISDVKQSKLQKKSDVCDLTVKSDANDCTKQDEKQTKMVFKSITIPKKQSKRCSSQQKKSLRIFRKVKKQIDNNSTQEPKQKQQIIQQKQSLLSLSKNSSEASFLPTSYEKETSELKINLNKQKETTLQSEKKEQILKKENKKVEKQKKQQQYEKQSIISSKKIIEINQNIGFSEKQSQNQRQDQNVFYDKEKNITEKSKLKQNTQTENVLTAQIRSKKSLQAPIYEHSDQKKLSFGSFADLNHSKTSFTPLISSKQQQNQTHSLWDKVEKQQIHRQKNIVTIKDQPISVKVVQSQSNNNGNVLNHYLLEKSCPQQSAIYQQNPYFLQTTATTSIPFFQFNVYSSDSFCLPEESEPAHRNNVKTNRNGTKIIRPLNYRKASIEIPRNENSKYKPQNQEINQKPISNCNSIFADQYQIIECKPTENTQICKFEINRDQFNPLNQNTQQLPSQNGSQQTKNENQTPKQQNRRQQIDNDDASRSSEATNVSTSPEIKRTASFEINQSAQHQYAFQYLHELPNSQNIALPMPKYETWPLQATHQQQPQDNNSCILIKQSAPDLEEEKVNQLSDLYTNLTVQCEYSRNQPPDSNITKYFCGATPVFRFKSLQSNHPNPAILFKKTKPDLYSSSDVFGRAAAESKLKSKKQKKQEEQAERQREREKKKKEEFRI